MYAILETGGKQFNVKEGDILRVEKLKAEVGAAVEMDKVLAVGRGKRYYPWKALCGRRQSCSEGIGAGKGQKGYDL